MPATYVVTYSARCRNDGEKRMKFKLDFESVKIYFNPFFCLFFLHSLFLFPQAGPDIKYLLGFIRTQFSTTTTIFLVFGPKILRVLRGQGDKWDHRSRARGITASFCTNGGGLMPDEGVDIYQENEELKVRVEG